MKPSKRGVEGNFFSQSDVIFNNSLITSYWKNFTSESASLRASLLEATSLWASLWEWPSYEHHIGKRTSLWASLWETCPNDDFNENIPYLVLPILPWVLLKITVVVISQSTVVEGEIFSQSDAWLKWCPKWCWLPKWCFSQSEVFLITLYSLLSFCLVFYLEILKNIFS